MERTVVHVSEAELLRDVRAILQSVETGAEFVIAGARNGAAVTYPRVKGLTERNPECLRSYVLGSVIAHELGHLLLGTARHGDGLMKANWVPADFDAMRQRRLRFSRADAQQMRAQCENRILARR